MIRKNRNSTTLIPVVTRQDSHPNYIFGINTSKVFLFTFYYVIRGNIRFNFPTFSDLELVSSGRGGRWKGKHEKNRGDLESWWEKSKNTDLERVLSMIRCERERERQTRSDQESEEMGGQGVFLRPSSERTEKAQRSIILLSRADQVSEYYCPISAECKHICVQNVSWNFQEEGNYSPHHVSLLF